MVPDIKKIKTAALEKSSHSEYFNIGVSVDCVILGYLEGELKVLLIESDMEEFSGMYSLIGDLVKPDEDLDEASYRVLRERTHLEDVFLQQVHTFGAVSRHPSGRVITTAYYSLININSHKLQIDENDLRWHNVTDIKKLAFDHKEILDTCLAQLRDQINEYPIVFNLLADKFSLRELQEVYESVLQTELDRRNFRKKIALKNWLHDTGEMEKSVSHRPGKLYKFKPKHLKSTPSKKR